MKSIVCMIKAILEKISLMLCTHNNTDGNKIVIFSGRTLYYGDNNQITYGSKIGNAFLFCHQ